ncbi:MAG: hemin uptake protein HemP [Povalibacter sp.]
MDEPSSKAAAKRTASSPGIAAGTASLPCVRSDSLFGKAREILIEHAGSFYRLRVTSSNKLILTK